MEKSQSGGGVTGGITRTLSRAAHSIREGMSDYLGLNETAESHESYYVNNSTPTTPTSPTTEPYWMKDNFWGTNGAGGGEMSPSAPPMDGVTVIPNSGYEEAPPPYTEMPPSYSAQFSSLPPGGEAMGIEMSGMKGSGGVTYVGPDGVPQQSPPMSDRKSVV